MACSLSPRWRQAPPVAWGFVSRHRLDGPVRTQLLTRAAFPQLRPLLATFGSVWDALSQVQRFHPSEEEKCARSRR
ncbi:hypothetical protein SCOCK_30420 [Actinacidiphila cocklensis]|uniref:Uncharacterized protein n=1 Tax=Actinacidiphila cocklensis TaxID=887465 RepID=A0A9W4E825_9ACTN|nr:hypothetical protein SCOCK_30420 [Actinacidiphila cocklensis]